MDTETTITDEASGGAPERQALLADALACLEHATALLSDRVRWTRGALARREDGEPCAPQDAAAARWCLDGALELAWPMAFPYQSWWRAREALKTAATSMGYAGIWACNDDGGYQAAREALACACAVLAVEADNG